MWPTFPSGSGIRRNTLSLGAGDGGGAGVEHEASSKRQTPPAIPHLLCRRSPESIGAALLCFHFHQELRSPDADNCDRGLNADSVRRKLGNVPRDKSHDAASHLDD
jgi:hypothetical protein